MIRTEKNGIVYFKFQSFERAGIRHGFFSRVGGVSPAPFNSLNLGSTTGDSNDHVRENRERIFDAVGLPVESIHDVWQVHGTDVLKVDSPRPLDQEHVPADGLVTNQTGITLFMRFADCVPIILAEPKKKVISIVHAGWQGTVNRIVQKAVKKMQMGFDIEPSEVIAGIGPCIRVDNYEVGKNVIDAVESNLIEFKENVIFTKNERTYLDLKRTNSVLLNQVGVKNIEVSEYCTFSDNDLWFSHRAEGYRSGRFAALISLD